MCLVKDFPVLRDANSRGSRLQWVKTIQEAVTVRTLLEGVVKVGKCKR